MCHSVFVGILNIHVSPHFAFSLGYAFACARPRLFRYTCSLITLALGPVTCLLRVALPRALGSACACARQHLIAWRLPWVLSYAYSGSRSWACTRVCICLYSAAFDFLASALGPVICLLRVALPRALGSAFACTRPRLFAYTCSLITLASGPVTCLLRVALPRALGSACACTRLFTGVN